MAPSLMSLFFVCNAEFYVYSQHRNLIMSSYPFQTRKAYSFDLHPSSILGTGFKNVTVQAILDYHAALAFADLDALHVNVFPHLPAGTPNRPQDFDYLWIRTQNGDTTIIGIPWIVEETIELVESLKMNVVIDGVGSIDIERVRACLSQNGYDKIEISLVGQ